MIVYARKGMVLEAKVWRPLAPDERVIVSLDTDQKATLTMRGMFGRCWDDKSDRLHELCSPRFKGTLRVKVLAADYTDPGRPRILVCETKKKLTRNAPRVAATPSHLMQRSGRAGQRATTARAVPHVIPRSRTKSVA